MGWFEEVLGVGIPSSSRRLDPGCSSEVSTGQRSACSLENALSATLRRFRFCYMSPAVATDVSVTCRRFGK